MNELIRFLRGYVKIKVSGDFAENFINLCVKNDVAIWGIEKHKDNMYLFMRADKYLLLVGLRHKIKGKIKIKLLEKHGLPIILRKHNKRKGLFVGLAVFLSINFLLSQFIWNISVFGNETIKEKDVIKICNEMNINIGDYRNNIDTYNAKQLIALKFDEIAWVSLNVEGSKIAINISEAHVSKHSDDYSPRNIIALEDGVIKSIKVIKGEKKIVVGQAVKKGDVLVSGVIENLVASHFVAAEGEILARTNRNYSCEIEKNHKIQKKGTDVEYRDVFEFFWIKIPLYLQGVNFEYTSELSNKNICLFGEKLPIGIARRTYHPLIQKNVQLTLQEAESIALSRAVNNLRELDVEGVISTETSVTDVGDRYIVDTEIVCLENIAEYVSINTDGY